MKKFGIVYVCWGDVTEELEKSINSLNGLPYLVVTDKEIEFNHICVNYPNHMKSYTRKILSYSLSPFEKTLYLDTDCIMLSSLDYAISKLDYYDMCLCQSPCYSLRHLNKDIVHFNSGVLFFNKCSQNDILFKRWEDIIFELKLRDEFEYDQVGLSIAIDEINPLFFTLPPTWNFRPHINQHNDKAFVHGPIKIWHSRDKSAENLNENLLSNKWHKPKIIRREKGVWRNSCLKIL